MDKIDLKQEFKHLYNPSAKEVVIVDVPKMNFLAIDGKGDPNNPAFQAAVDVLYSVAYTLKFMLKKGKTAMDYTVMPLEGLWWTDDMTKFNMENKDIWQWTLTIAQPDFITAGQFKAALEQLKKKKDNALLAKIRFESFHEGLAAQIMHIGPYATEGHTVARIHAFAREKGYKLHGKHHEIYMSDPRRVAPDKMKTVIRQPIRKLQP